MYAAWCSKYATEFGIDQFFNDHLSSNAQNKSCKTIRNIAEDFMNGKMPIIAMIVMLETAKPER